jgi:hypothetical protein
MLRHHRIGIFRQRTQGWHKLCVSTVAHGNDRIAAEAGKFGAADRRPSKDAAEIFWLHLSQPVECGVHQSFPRLKFR